MGPLNDTLELRIAVVKYYLSGQGGIKRTDAHFGLHKSTVSHRVGGFMVIAWYRRYHLESRGLHTGL